MSADSGLEREIVTALRRITRAIDRYSRRLAQEYGLTGPQLVVLHELVRSVALPTGELARRVHLAQGTVSEILDRLENSGYVTRVRSGTDRRRVECSATEAGRDLVFRSPSLLQDRFVEELRRLTDWERNSLLASLQRVAEMMDIKGVEAAPLLSSGPATASPEETAHFLREANSPTEDDVEPETA